MQVITLSYVKECLNEIKTLSGEADHRWNGLQETDCKPTRINVPTMTVGKTKHDDVPTIHVVVDVFLHNVVSRNNMVTGV